jgi:hypothetical protein
MGEVIRIAPEHFPYPKVGRLLRLDLHVNTLLDTILE